MPLELLRSASGGSTHRAQRYLGALCCDLVSVSFRLPMLAIQTRPKLLYVKVNVGIAIIGEGI